MIVGHHQSRRPVEPLDENSNPWILHDEVVGSPKELAALIDRELQKQLAPIKSLLAEILKELQEPSFSEIIGGIGYIFGLFGIIAWAYSRKK
jgi:nickel transport protein